MKKLLPCLKPAAFSLLGLCLSASVLATETLIVEIQNFKFIPQEITVKPDTTIRWVNNEKRQYHSVWFEALGEAEPEYFFPDESYERHFATEGSFPYRCGPHPEMTGVVHVRK